MFSDTLLTELEDRHFLVARNPDGRRQVTHKEDKGSRESH